MRKFSIGALALSFAAGAMLAAPLSLSAADPYRTGRRAADGYNWNPNPPFSRDTVQVTLVRVKSRAELVAALEKRGGAMLLQRADGEAEWPVLHAFSAVSRTESKCTIWIVDPAVRYKPEDYGHELTHCFYGAWHE